MAPGAPGNHFIPRSRADLFAALLEDPRLAPAQKHLLQAFCGQLQSILHYEMHARLEELKRLYGPFNPDSALPATAAPGDAARLWEQLELLLTDANFARVSPQDLATAFAAEGMFPISLDVDFDEFADFRIYFHGTSRGSYERAGPLPLMKRRRDFEVLDWVVVAFKLKPAEYFAARGRKRPPGIPGKLYLKYLRGVPRADLETLFPNSRPRMKLIHKLKIGLPLLTGLGITGHKLILAPFVLGTGGNPFSDGLSLPLVAILAGLGGYVFKAWSGYKSTVQSFLAEITNSLYFKNLVSNQGVFASLIDNAEEEESKEAVLAYTFLLLSPEPLDEARLDASVEGWLRTKLGLALDFECDDALRGLQELGLVEQGPDGLRSLSLEQALERLDARWDGYFSYPPAALPVAREES